MSVSLNAALVNLVQLRSAFEDMSLPPVERAEVVHQIEELFRLLHVEGVDASGIDSHFGQLRKYAGKVPEVTAFGDLMHIL